MSFIDCHCHLDYFPDEEIAEIVVRAREAGVKKILNNGVSAMANRKILRLCEKYDEVKACLGIYPLDALEMESKEIDAEIDFIRKNKKKIFAIGEVGMDFKEKEEKIIQERNFRKFVSLAIELDVPIIVHSRKAERECVEILEEMNAKKVVMHCFCGKRSLVSRVVENGWYLTVPTCVTRNEQFQWLVKEVSIDRLLCETDAPFMHPEGPDAGKNEPANVVVSYEKIAEIKGLKLKEVEKKIEANFRQLFF